MKYEYTATHVQKANNILMEMNNFDTEGWEAFSVIARDDGWVIFFKRPVEDRT